MRYILAAALWAGLTAGAAQAAMLDLTYTVEAEVTDYFYNDAYAGTPYSNPYPGPEIGESVFFDFHIAVDTEVERYSKPLGSQYSYVSYSDFDIDTGSISYTIMPNDEEVSEFVLSADGRGTVFESLLYHDGGQTFANIDYDVLSWSVEGLPEIAPVPLPASLPLLGVGIAAIGFAKRRKAKRSA